MGDKIWSKVMSTPLLVSMSYLSKVSRLFPCGSKCFLNSIVSSTRFSINRLAMKKTLQEYCYESTSHSPTLDRKMYFASKNQRNQTCAVSEANIRLFYNYSIKTGVLLSNTCFLGSWRCTRRLDKLSGGVGIDLNPICLESPIASCLKII